MDFFHYMFWPLNAPWFTGAFWSNQVQWTVVTLPSFVIFIWHLERKNRKRHEDLKKHITETLQK